MKSLIKLSLAMLLVLATAAALSAARPNRPQRPQRQQADSVAAMSSEVRALMARAAAGDADAQNRLGMCYLKGNGVEANDELAYRWFAKAAAQRLPSAVVNVAYCVRHGRGVKADSLQAQTLYINAMALGGDTIISRIDRASRTDIFLSRTLAKAFEDGKGIKHSTQKQIKYLRQAIDLGDKSALYPFGLASLRVRDHATALNAFRRAHELGQKDATYWYGRYLITGEAGTSDPAAGFRLVMPFAQNGLVGAQNLVGACYRDGTGTEASLPQAAKWFGRAAEKGSPNAQWDLAMLLLDGGDVDRDLFQAFYRMNRAATRTSENRFKTFADPKDGDLARHDVYLLFLQGLRADNDADYATLLKVAKALGKLKAPEAKVLEGLYYINPSNPKRDVKKGYRLLLAELNNPYVKYLVAQRAAAGQLQDAGQQINVGQLLEEAAADGVGEAYSFLADLYAAGKGGLPVNEQKALVYYLKAMDTDGLTFASSRRLADCYDRGAGGLNEDKEKARAIRSAYKGDYMDIILGMVPVYTGK